MLILVFVAASLAAGFSLGPTGPVQDVAVEQPPAALQQIGDSAVAMFDDTLAGRWADVSAELKGIEQRLSELPESLPFPDVVALLHDRIRSLRQGVPAHDTLTVLDDANALTRLVMQIADGFEVTVPFEVAILPYYGRQLEIGAMSGSLIRLRQISRDLRAMWTRAEPMVLMRGDTADARRFTDTVVNLEAARRPSDFKRLAKTELDAAASLIRQFESGG
jgi:hypothetical protein